MTIPTIPEYKSLDRTPFDAFLAASGARCVSIRDAGMYGNRIVYIEHDRQLYQCHGYESQNGPFSAATHNLEPAEWETLKGWNSPGSFSEWIDLRVESAKRSIDEERKYIGNVVAQYVEKYGSLEAHEDDWEGRSLAHINARARGMQRLSATYKARLDEQRALRNESRAILESFDWGETEEQAEARVARYRDSLEDFYYPKNFGEGRFE